MYGQKDDPKKCCKSVPTAGMRIHYHQCTKPVTCTRNGKKYCNIHDPEVVAKKRAERFAKWDAEYKAKKK